MNVSKKKASAQADSRGATGGTGALFAITQQGGPQSSALDTDLVTEKSPDDFSYEGDSLESVEPNHASETKHGNQHSADY